MGRRNRTRGGKKLLIAVVLGPLCAAAAELPVRIVPNQAEPAMPIPAVLSSQIESLAAKVLEPNLALPASVQKAPNSNHSPAPAGPTSGWQNPETNPARLLIGRQDGPVRLQWFARPTSKGP